MLIYVKQDDTSTIIISSHQVAYYGYHCDNVTKHHVLQAVFAVHSPPGVPADGKWKLHTIPIYRTDSSDRYEYVRDFLLGSLFDSDCIICIDWDNDSVRQMDPPILVEQS